MGNYSLYSYVSTKLKILYGNNAACGKIVHCSCDSSIGEVGLVNFIYSLKVAQILKEDGDLNNVIYAHIYASQDVLDVLESLISLLLDAA